MTGFRLMVSGSSAHRTLCGSGRGRYFEAKGVTFLPTLDERRLPAGVSAAIWSGLAMGVCGFHGGFNQSENRHELALLRFNQAVSTVVVERHQSGIIR